MIQKLLLHLFLIAVSTATAQRNVTYRSHLPYKATLANVWGYYDTVNQKEYALVGVETGLSIVDVTNPDKPKEVFFVDTDSSLWQEPKTWKQYVYMTNENGTKGLLIVDMSNLPGSVNALHWKGSPAYDYRGRSHSCFIDENGILYLTGSQVNNGVLIFDLKPNPLAPTYLGLFDRNYVHDCFARNDTLWTAEIINGNITVVDVRNKANPTLMARFQTPYAFAHNCWVSTDGKYLYTTDERPYATVASYDVSDLSNITLLDEYRHSYYDSLIPHNTHISHDSFLYTSYYRAGFTIVDAHRPDNLVEVGQYDTSPFGDANGFEGCWGVYPFLPSGNILASDRQEGLFVLTPTLKRACYLEGKITSQSGTALPGVEVNFINTKSLKRSNFSGNYKYGIGDAGKYDLRVYDPQQRCATRIIKDVQMEAGKITQLDIQLNCVLSGVDDLQQPNVFVYPTVFNGYATLYNATADLSVIAVLDFTGAQVDAFTAASSEVKIGEHIPAGMYFVKVRTGQQEQVVRMIKVN